MMPIEEKLKRLADIATMYYKQDFTQQEIAEAVGVSRPMISKLLAEAKELGIVSFTINQPTDAQQILSLQIERQFKLKQAIVVQSKDTALETNERIVQAAYALCSGLCAMPQYFGVGWGSMLGKLAEYVERNRTATLMKGQIFPLIGGVKASYRSYHPNELVRLISEGTGLADSYLYIPAMVESTEEKRMYEKSEAFREIRDFWGMLTTALINISNYPSTPDLATAFRFGSRLSQRQAVGSFLAHYFDASGGFIEPEANNILQCSVPQLRNAKNVVALCNCNLRPEGVMGALRTGVITHVLLSDELAMQILHQSHD